LIAAVLALVVCVTGQASTARAVDASSRQRAALVPPKRELVFASDRADDLRNSDLYVVSADLRTRRDARAQ
jgi:hypothetical protein